MAASASIHWLSSPLYSNFVAYCEETGNGRWASIVQRFAKFQGDGWSVPTVSRVELGRLAFKEEAAGKVRVFALVDYWTQLVLYPLHALMGKILREIPQDGTFDQARPLLRLVESMKDRGLHSCWSYDLSAATDRLPVDLQEILLAALFTPRMAANWKAILVGREYWLPKEHGYAGVPEGAPVSYAVGQPMGAYSSWTALALTHHFIVQWASWRASKGSFSWFADYAVLGDDVVIANRAVAREYRLLMHQLGVTISLPKSLESHNLSLEFAKRFIWKGEDCSPLSIKEFSVALGHLDTFVSMIGKVSSWMGGVRLATAVGTLGFGYRVKSTMFAPLKSLGKRIQGTLLMLTAPGKAFGVDSFTEWVAQRKLGESLELTQSEQAKIMLCLISKAWLPLHDRIVRVSSQYQFHQEAMLRPGLQGGPNGLYAETMVSPLYADASRDLHLAGMITWSTLHEVELTGVPPSHWTVNGLAWVWEETKLVNKVCMRVPSQILVREQLETEDVPHVGFAPGRLLAIYRMAWRKALVGR
jgi:hypothetical protein